MMKKSNPTSTSPPSQRHIRHRLARILTVLALFSGVAAVWAEPAHAASPFVFRYKSDSHTRPSYPSRFVRVYLEGDPETVMCQAFGQRWGLGAYAGNMTWDKLSDGSWVHDMTTQLPGGIKVNVPGGYGYFTPGIPRCKSGTPRSTTLRMNATGYADIKQRDEGAPDPRKGDTVTVVCQTNGPRWGSGTYASNATWNMLSDGTWIHDMTTNLPGGTKVWYGSDYAYYTAGIPRCH